MHPPELIRPPRRILTQLCLSVSSSVLDYSHMILSVVHSLIHLFAPSLPRTFAHQAWDPDRNGELTLKELSLRLRQGGTDAINIELRQEKVKSQEKETFELHPGDAVVEQGIQQAHIDFLSATKKKQQQLREDLQRKKAMAKQLSQLKTTYRTMMKSVGRRATLARSNLATVHMKEDDGPAEKKDVWAPYRAEARRKAYADTFGGDEKQEDSGLIDYETMTAAVTPASGNEGKGEGVGGADGSQQQPATEGKLMDIVDMKKAPAVLDGLWMAGKRPRRKDTYKELQLQRRHLLLNMQTITGRVAAMQQTLSPHTLAIEQMRMPFHLRDPVLMHHLHETMPNMPATASTGNLLPPLGAPDTPQQQRAVTATMARSNPLAASAPQLLGATAAPAAAGSRRGKNGADLGDLDPYGLTSKDLWLQHSGRLRMSPLPMHIHRLNRTPTSSVAHNLLVRKLAAEKAAEDAEMRSDGRAPSLAGVRLSTAQGRERNKTNETEAAAAAETQKAATKAVMKGVKKGAQEEAAKGVKNGAEKEAKKKVKKEGGTTASITTTSPVTIDSKMDEGKWEGRKTDIEGEPTTGEDGDDEPTTGTTETTETDMYDEEYAGDDFEGLLTLKGVARGVEGLAHGHFLGDANERKLGQVTNKAATATTAATESVRSRRSSEEGKFNTRRSSSRSSKSSVSATGTDLSWNCFFCTWKNVREQERCKMCGKNRAENAQEAVATGDAAVVAAAGGAVTVGGGGTEGGATGDAAAAAAAAAAATAAAAAASCRVALAADTAAEGTVGVGEVVGGVSLIASPEAKESKNQEEDAAQNNDTVAMASSTGELRVDADGGGYTQAQFVSHYGGTDEWDAAELAEAQLAGAVSRGGGEQGNEEGTEVGATGEAGEMVNLAVDGAAGIGGVVDEEVAKGFDAEVAGRELLLRAEQDLAKEGVVAGDADMVENATVHGEEVDRELDRIYGSDRPGVLDAPPTAPPFEEKEAAEETYEEQTYGETKVYVEEEACGEVYGEETETAVAAAAAEYSAEVGEEALAGELAATAVEGAAHAASGVIPSGGAGAGVAAYAPAEEGYVDLAADLHDGWAAVQDEGGNTYYVHEATGESTWECPWGNDAEA